MRRSDALAARLFGHRIQRVPFAPLSEQPDLGQELTHRALAPALDPGCDRIRGRDSRDLL
jgi:hypothetical protein